ncbi:hypothetical protein AAFF_G00370760 [Aldrovandia affinis]|uniref:CARD domain-containing protein n=1 Tax=Aldrovandia affinis TaxID=143900 RepID=A0AAD7SGM9_9TELE|nr:hypothetical protein AAFF_G00370760 [Aldrovandia affinis]
MADTLFRIRIKFVEKVSESSLDQLLDDLLSRRVLNAAEVEEVKQGNSQRMDQARSLIDMVRNKGDEASHRLLDCLQLKNPALWKELQQGLLSPEEPNLR